MRISDWSSDVCSSDLSIVFDTNDAIETPVWTNGIDVASPTSAAGALPASTPGETIEVTWDGADAGAGVDTYDVYVSRDGGPFRIWRPDTKASSRTYRGEIGYTYSFELNAVDGERKSVVAGLSESVRVELGGGRSITIKPHIYHTEFVISAA